MKRFYTILIAVFFTMIHYSAKAQESLIKGNVIGSDDRLPVIGSTVLIEGTNNATLTDYDGNFQIEVKNGETLVVSFVGYKTQKITISEQKFVNVLLEPNIVQLESVVVTALGIKREEKALGYSVQKISNEEVQKVSGLDVATSLTGKIAGLMVKNSTDFGSAPEISIRGEAPLLVIDGVPYSNMTMRDIAADDIESMSVLKGATASALYGYRGSNGAIMITTKNGSTGNEGVSVSISSNTMFSAGFVAIPDVQSTYGRGTTNTYNKDSDQAWGAFLDGSIRMQWDPMLKADREYAYEAVGKDNFKRFLEQGYVTNNSVSVAYQSKKVSVRNSLNWTETKGQYPNSKFDKFSYSFGGDVNLDKLKLSSNISYHKQSSPNIGFNGYTSYDPMYTLLIWTAPDYDILDYKDYWMIPNEKQNFTYKKTHNNPYFDRNEKVKQINRDIFNASFSASYDVTNWLKASLRTGLDFYSNREDIRVSKDSYVSTGNTGAGGGATWIGQWTGAYATGRNNGYSINNDFILTGDKSWGRFTLDGLLGGTIYYKKDDAMFGNTVNGLSVPGFFSLKASVDPAATGSSVYQQQVNSIYGRLAISWDRWAFVEGTVRNDWSSTLPKDTRSYLYPSISGSIIASELMPKYDFLNMWKFRGSWTASKTPPGIYETNTNFNVTNSAWGTMESASMPSSMADLNVRPQSASTLEFGTQAVFFGNRLSFDVSYYDKLMYDFLVYGPISEASGFTSKYVNSNEKISRRGWEISANMTPIKTKNWNWDLGLNWSKYARYYVEIDKDYSSDKPWVKVGERVDVYAINDYALDSEGNHIFHNGRIQFNPYQSKFGNYDPDWIWGINTNVSYKNLTLSVSLDGRVGGLTNAMTESYMWTSGVHPSSVTPERAKDVQTPGSSNFLGQGVKVVSGSVSYDAYGNVLSDNRVFAPNDVYTTYSQYAKDMHAGIAWGGQGRPADCYSTTFIKLREMSLTYSVPKKYISKYSQGASVSLVGQNLWMWAKDFKYSDPDGGIDNFNDPSVRYIGFNIKLTL